MAKRADTRHVDVLKEARERFKRCQNWESTFQSRYKDDVKFAEGDSDNLYQWPENIRGRMEADRKAMLTINIVRQHCLDVLNDARQARVGIKIRPTGDGSSVDSAKIYMGVVRHIEYTSNADQIYQTGLKFAVQGGIGYWRVVTDYLNDNSFDQEIFLRRVKDPLTVYLDPDINEFDGSDARFGFITTMIPKEEFERQYPRAAANLGAQTEIGADTWATVNKVRIAEYYRQVATSEKLLAYDDPEAPGEMKVAREGELAPAIVKELLKLPTTQVRSVKTHKVEWFKIVGNEVVEERDWPGIYIPIIRCVGEETVIDNQLDRKGHVRALKDGQRMFNVNASGSIEFGALQSKTPYITPADAIEGYETYWESANTENHAVLPFNHMDDEGEAIPAPTRQEPPRSAPVYMQGMIDAANWLRQASGQWQADMGQPSNERSGVAIMQRQRQGDNATYHYLDHQAIAIRFTGKILIDLIPKVYDTARVMTIIAENGTETRIKVDPNATKALETQKDTREEVQAIFNPKVGRYEVESDVGPSFATKRQETVQALTELMKARPELVAVIGDLAVSAMDFAGAEDAAARLKRMVPAQALGDGPPPELVQAQGQIEAMQTLVKRLAQQLADKTGELRIKGEATAVSAYDAQTKRLAAIKDALNLKPELLLSLVEQVILEAEATSGPGLGPALTPDPSPADVVGEPPQAALPAPGAPPGPAGGATEPVGEPLGNDMGAGPAAPGGAGGAPPV